MPETYTRAEVAEWLTDLSIGKLDLRADTAGLASAALDLIEGAPSAPSSAKPDDDQLSPHFTLTELTRSGTAQKHGIDNAPDAAAIEQLSALANDTLERIRTICGDNPVLISSGYRSAAVNDHPEVGGAENSAHVHGCAADFTIPAFGSVPDICRALQPHLAALEIDQLIDESSGGARWVHVGRAIPPTAPRRQFFRKGW